MELANNRVTKVIIIIIIVGQFNLIKLMISHDLPRSTITNQITSDQQDSNSIPDFERAMDLRCQALVSDLETLDRLKL